MPNTIAPITKAERLYFDDLFERRGLDLDPLAKKALTLKLLPKLRQVKTYKDAPLLWTPITKAQERAQITLADETFFGGRAGCGKTYLLIGLACTEHTEAILFRQEYSQLKDIIKKSRVLLSGTGARYNSTDKIWSDIPGGRTLEFGACKYDDDVEKFRGREHDLVAFDEIATFREDHYLDLCGWARTTNPNQRVRIICAGNPPFNPEDFWVKQRFACWVDDKHPNPAAPGEIRYFARIDDKDTEVDSPEPFMHDGEEIKPLSRTFIPGEAMLDSLKGTGYEARLQGLREPLRSQLLYGDFTIGVSDQDRQVIKTEHVRLAFERWENMQKPDVPLSGLGVDVARGGRDQTIISKLYDTWFAPLLKYDAVETKTGNDVATAVIACMEGEAKKSPIIIDATGVGTSPHDILVSHEFNVDAFMGAAKSALTSQDDYFYLDFYNRRAESWWLFAEALDPDSKSHRPIALPPDNELLADLTSVRFKIDTRGILIEPKEDIIKRLGRSPDAGDAVVMAFNVHARHGENYSFF